MFSREYRFREFRSWYRKIPPNQIESVFEGLWQTEYLTHSELVEMATDTIRVMERAVEIEEGEDSRSSHQTHVNAGISLVRYVVSRPTLGWKI